MVIAVESGDVFKLLISAGGWERMPVFSLCACERLGGWWENYECSDNNILIQNTYRVASIRTQNDFVPKES